MPPAKAITIACCSTVAILAIGSFTRYLDTATIAVVAYDIKHDTI
jgi:hypothetical protein